MKPLKISSRYLLVVNAAIVLLLAQQPTQASPSTWSATPVDATWANAGNWSTGVPTSADTATFNTGSTQTTIDLGSGATVGGVIFDTTGAAAYTIGAGAAGSQTLTLGATTATGTIAMTPTVTNNELFNSNLTLGTDGEAAAYTITNSTTGHTLTFAGAITGGTGTPGIKTLTISDLGGGTFINGSITAGGASALNLTKTGAGALNLNGSSTLGSLIIGQTTAISTTITSGTVTVGSGQTMSLTSLIVGASGLTNAVTTGNVLDVSASNGLTVNSAGPIIVAGQTASATGMVITGTLKLGGTSSLTTTGNFEVGYSAPPSGSSQAQVVGKVTTAANSTTTIIDAAMDIGYGKSSSIAAGQPFDGGSFTLGSGSIVTIGSTATRGTLNIGVNSYQGTGTGAATGGITGVLDGTATPTTTTLKLNVSGIQVGAFTNVNGGTAGAAATGSLLFSNSTSNHLNVLINSAAGNAVLVGSGTTTSTVSGDKDTGIVTIGDLDNDGTSVISNINAAGTGPLILLARGGADTTPATDFVGTLTLGHGTGTTGSLTLTSANTSGAVSAIAGGVGTSTVNFRGLTLVAGSASTSWITGITNANVGDGGLIIDTGTFAVGVSQNFVHDFTSTATDGGLTKLGTGTLTLSGSSSYNGTTTLANGILNLGSSTAVPLSFTTNNITFTGGTLQFSSSSASNDYSAQIKNSTGVVSIDTNGQSVGLANAIASSNTGGLAKTGAGTLTLASASGNSYTGATTVSVGTLLVSNTSGSATGTGPLTVATGATVGGAGRINASSFAINGNVQVGNGVDATSKLIMTGAAASTITNANLAFNLDTAVLGNSNVLSVGNTNLQFTTTTLTLNLQGLAIIPDTTQYTLFSGTTTSGTGLLGSGFGGDITVDGSNKISGLSLAFQNAPTPTFYQNSYLQLVANGSGGFDIDLNVNAVPEPGTWAMMLGGLAMLVVWQRRKNQLSKS